jgi:hypothetical protein
MRHLMRLMLLGFVGFVLGLTGGWSLPPETPLSAPLARVTGRASEGGVRGDYGLPETMTNFVELDAHNSKPADLRRVTEFDDDE